MKCGVLSFMFVIYFITGFSQVLPQQTKKTPIDFDAIKKWSILGNAAISNDGEYCAYTIYNHPVDGMSTLVIKSIHKSWSKDIISKGSPVRFFFSGDSREIIYLKLDTLFFQTLGNDGYLFIPNVNAYQVPTLGKGEWMAYKMKNGNNELVLRDLFTGKEQRFNTVTDFTFNAKGNVLLVKTTSVNDSLTKSTLQWIDLPGNAITIWSTEFLPNENVSVSGYNFDSKGEQFVFMVQDKRKTYVGNSIWYYKAGKGNAVTYINEYSSGIDTNLCISNNPPQFSQNGQNIFFKLQLKEFRRPNTTTVKVDVWSYKDVVLQSEQLNDSYYKDFNAIYSAVKNVHGDKVIRVENVGQKLETYPYNVTSDYVIVSDKQEFPWWKREGQESFYLVSLNNGIRKFLKKGRSLYFSFSPTGRYLIYFDGKKKNYFSYNLQTGVTLNVSKAITTRLDNEYAQNIPGRTYPIPFSISGWLEQDSALLVYDNYDIWKISTSGKSAPENVTNGYGKRNHIKFRLVYESEALQGLSYKEPLLLTAFDTENKHNGFYWAYMCYRSLPKLLTMGAFLLYRVSSQVPIQDWFDSGMKPIKAWNVDSWIVKRQTSSEAPNYFLTTDFKKYTTLSDIQPQKGYNWLNTELVTWKQLDGTLSQGILYKPENFNPQKKYPLILHYYEQFSYRLYEYPYPRLTDGRINIPWFVSRGYLVFTPDIHYSIAKTSGRTIGDCSVNSVVSAAQYLSRLPYVNSLKIGIQGHSYSGGETLYLIAHSNIFAAACAASSTVSDEISAYLGIIRSNGRPTGQFRLSHAEIGHDRIGATLWQRPDLYIKNSPIFRANRISTPLFMMHNLGDDAVDWGQSVEMYMALRRLEKKVWMVQYDGQGHVLSGESARDYTIRITQFFDHYLMGVLPPKWMTDGIPARLKGIETGYELDDSGRKP